MAARPNNATNSTIFAQSSGRLPAGIAVMRISGPRARAVLLVLAGSCPEPRVATLRTLRDTAGAMLDRALVLWFPGPASVTGEDVAELHLHGSIAVVAAVSAVLEGQGLRLAEPGEFTRRALASGRMRLDEVEGLADLLAAETETQRREAMLRTSGAVARRLADWTRRVVDLSAQIEAAIDYDESDETATLVPAATILALRSDIAAALAVPSGERLREGVRVAIVGPVNAGKSSLFNALVGSEAAIVSDRAGTTRDVVERAIALRDIPFLLLDTAGQRETEDAIERIGIERAARADRDADIVLDLSDDVTCDDRRIAVAAKCDLRRSSSDAIAVSSLTGEGLPDLIDALVASAKRLLPAPGEATLVRRHRDVLEVVSEHLAFAAKTDDLVLAAEHLGGARRALGSVGESSGTDEMLDALFTRFCLGK